jgi:hypothetical protein
MAIVYQHKNTLSGKVFYIGIGKTEKRAYSKHSRGKFWKDYTSKYDYEVEITHRDIIWEEACSIEKYLISFYGRRDLGLGELVNQTDGGEGGNLNLSEEIKEKMKEPHRGDKNHMRRPEYSGENHHNKKLENRLKISLAKKGKPPWNKEKSTSNDIKKKISMSCKGREAPNKKQVINVNTGEVYSSVKEASLITGIIGISAVCRGERKHAKGIVFKYLIEK